MRSAKRPEISSITGSLRDQRRRFFNRYSEGIEGTLASGERVLLWTLRTALSSRDEMKDFRSRLFYLIKSGVRMPPLIDYGVDAQGTPYLLTQWKNLEPAALAARRHSNPAGLFWQMVKQVSKLHRGGMPFGDIAESSFLVDPNGRVFLCGIPAYDYPLPLDATSDQVTNYLAPEQASGEDTFFEQDVYALGVAAHLIFTRRAFPRASSRAQLEEFLKSQTTHMLTLYQNVPSAVHDVLKACLAWDPSERCSVSELEAETRRWTSFRERMNWLSADMRDIRIPRFSLSGLSEISQAQVLTASIIFFLIVIAFQHGADWLRRNPGAQEGAAVVAVEQAQLSLHETLKQVETGGGARPSTDGALPKLLAGMNQQKQQPEGAEARRRPDRISELQRFSYTMQSTTKRRPSMRTMPERELIALLNRDPLLPKGQFYPIAEELLARETIRVPQRVALLALLHFDPSLLRVPERKALLNVVAGSVTASQIVDLSRWPTEDGQLVIAGLAAYAPRAETVYAAYAALTNIPLQAEPMATLIALAKQEAWELSLDEIRALATLSLGGLARGDDISHAVRRLEPRSNPLHLLLTLNGSYYRRPGADWCPIPLFSASGRGPRCEEP